MRNRRFVRPLQVLTLLLVVHCLPLPMASAQDATITERAQLFRTYPFGDPDPVARMSNIYPYFRFQGYSINPTSREWKVVTLENPYIRVLVAPEVGGKILGAFEKSTGRAFIYYNHVMKFREIAMRGAWTSGGIEFNFGDFGHTPTTATPVDYVTRKNQDGSVSCIVGALDLPSRTEWRVEIRLPRDKAYFETRSFWYNPTDLSTSRYHWMNAAAEADSDLQIIYPGNTFIGHGGEPASWPIDKQGRDLSLYRNNAFGSYKSYHVLGRSTDFFGGRWMHDDVGVLHWSHYADKPGKKLWIWGLSREGDIWKDLLTDPDLGNDQYVELQSGLHFNQAAPTSSMTPFKHMTFPSCSDERFAEAWFPFKGTGGVSSANLHGVLNVRQVRGKLVVGLCPLETMNVECSVMFGSQKVYARRLSLRPLEPFVDSLTLPTTGTEYAVRIGNVLEYRSQDDTVSILSRPIASAYQFDWSSAYGLSTGARERVRQRDYNGGFAQYRSSLKRDPTFIPSLAGIAELFYRRMEYDSALAYATRILTMDTYDPDGNYVYGLVQRRFNRLHDAEDAFGIAARSHAHRSAASVQLAEIAFIQDHMPDAEEYANRALDYDRYNIRARQLLAVVYRLLGEVTAANQTLLSIAEDDPLNHFARFEAYLLDPTEANRDAFTALIRNELPHETFLELANYYVHIRQYKDAIRVLQLAPSHAMVRYWLAYLLNGTGDLTGARSMLARAEADPPTLVFPHRSESEEVLKWADRFSPHWKTKYYLALLFWSKGREEQAREYFRQCGTEPDFYPFYLARGNCMNEDKISEPDYRRGLELAPNDWRPYSALVDFCNQRARYREALSVSAKGASRFSGNYMLQFLHARTLLYAGDVGGSLAILDTLTILPFEGARYGRDVYRQACVLSAVTKIEQHEHEWATKLLVHAREWPERLGAGRPYDVDSRIEDYLEALESDSEQNKTRAGTLLNSVADYPASHPESGSAQNLLSAFALRRLGKTVEGKKLLQAWINRDSTSTAARWSLLIFDGDYTGARMLEQDLRSGVLHRATGDQEFILVVDVVNKLGLR